MYPYKSITEVGYIIYNDEDGAWDVMIKRGHACDFARAQGFQEEPENGLGTHACFPMGCKRSAERFLNRVTKRLPVGEIRIKKNPKTSAEVAYA